MYLETQALLFYILTYAVMVLFLVIEKKFLRQGQQAKSLQETEQDQGTTFIIGLAFVLSWLTLLVTPFVNYFGIGILEPSLFFSLTGLLGMIVGIIIRIIATQTLGHYYTRMLQTNTDQVIIDKGLYRYIRHPGYLGNIILFVAAGIAVNNILATILISIMIISEYVRRIRVEEAMLIERFGSNYTQYAMRTKKLFPYVF